jgi:alkylation response protein AidB-like acyl-CoA dehydrogenase
MNFELSEEQRAIQDLARGFAAKEIAPHAAKWDEDCTFPIETLRQAASLGFAGLYVREDVGGSALSRLDGVLVFEELAAACASTAAFLSIENMCFWMIDRFGSEAQRRELLPDLVSLHRTASYCLTEPGAGSDAASLATRARRDGDHYVLDGTKAFISGAGTSDLYLVICRTGGDGPDGLTALIVPKDTPGLGFGTQEKKMGWHSQPTAMVILEQARVPLANRLGAEGDGFKIAMMALDGGRLNIGACSLGAARASFEVARENLLTRRQFGRLLKDFQALQFRIADMASDLESARLLLYRAAWMLDQEAPDATLHCAMAKRLATDAGFSVCNQALQLLGGYGYLRDHPVERHLRDLRVHQILEGTNEIMRVVVARRLLAE